MRVDRQTATALAVCAVAWGCTPMPKIEPVDAAAERVTGIGQPFVFATKREPIDVADPAATSKSLAFDDAVRRSLAHSPAVQAALARVRQAQAEAQQSRLLPNPILSVAFRLPTSGGRPDVEASLTANLLSLLLKSGQISAADSRLRRSSAEALVVVLDVLAQTQSQYAKVQALGAQLQINEARRQILQKLLDVTNALVQSGEAGRLSALSVQSESAELEAEILQLQSDDRQARLKLAELIGQPSSAADWKVDTWTPPAEQRGNEPDWIKLALERRPEIQAIVWELAALGQEMKLKHLWPVIDGGDAGVAAENTEGNWTLGPAANVALPVFDTGQAQRALIAARIAEQKHELTRIERQIVQEVRTAIEQFRAARLTLEYTHQHTLPLQEQRLKQAENLYQAGATDILVVRLAEQDLQRARARQVELQERLSQARFQLMRAIGGATPAAKP